MGEQYCQPPGNRAAGVEQFGESCRCGGRGIFADHPDKLDRATFGQCWQRLR